MSFFSDDFDNNLMGDRIKDKLENIEKIKPVGGYTISDKIANVLSMIYTDYIQHNKMVTAITLAIVIFLIYRYCKKMDRESMTIEEGKKLRKEMNRQVKHIKYDEQPSFNPLKPVSKQMKKVNYIPEPIYVDIPDKGLVDGRKLYPYAKPFKLMNEPKDNYSNVYGSTRNYYGGTTNTYLDAQDTLIPHPYDWPTDNITSTGDFVGYMTKSNNKTLVNYQNSVDSKNESLFNNIGPHSMDINSPELEMEPPYLNEIF